MLEILRDSIWQFVGAVLAFISVILAVVFFIIQARNKQLSYTIVSSNSLISVEKSLGKRVEILFDDHIVQDVKLIILKIFNSGNTSIDIGDYRQNITISFEDTVELLGADVIETTPKDLAKYVTINVTTNTISVDPTLLNRRDSITLKLLINNLVSVENIKVEGRIKDVKSIRRIQNTRNEFQYNLISFMSFVLVGSMLTILVLAATTSFVASPVEPIIAILIVIGVSFFGGMIARRR